MIEILKQIPTIPGYLLTGAQLIRWAFHRYKSWKRAQRPAPKELIAHRVGMRKEIEKNLQSSRRRINGSQIEVIDYEEIIVRNVRRMDIFPELDEHGVGISPWFKVDVNGFYHRGIEVFLSDERKVIPVVDAHGFLGGWRFLEEGEDSESAIYAISIGRIPFDFIESIDWSRSDGYYNAPHFYCRFDGPLRGPYEDVVYKAILYPDTSRYYHELEGLRRDTYKWGFFRRRTFLFRQDVIRCWRWLKKSTRRRKQ